MFHLVFLIWLWGETNSSDQWGQLNGPFVSVWEGLKRHQQRFRSTRSNQTSLNVQTHPRLLAEWVFSDAYLAVRRRVNPVMVDPPLVPQRYGPLPGAALALADQEAPVDARAEQVLGGVARHGPVVPAVLLQAVDGGDVVGRHPALAILGLSLAPLAIVVVTEHTQLLS